MSEEAIVGKLRSELQEEVASERQVVYILVEIRKLLNIHNQTKAFNVLNLHCNWGMHVSLDRDAAQKLIIDLNKSYSGLNVGDTAEQSFKELWNHLSFDLFHKQFRAFLRERQLPDVVCGEGSWQAFLRYYSYVIQDCPLVCPQKGSVGNLRFDKLLLAASRAQNNLGSAAHIQIKWEIYHREVKIADFTFPAGGRALIARTLLPKG